MGTEHPIELSVQVSAENTTDEDIDRMTRQLLSELRELDVESPEFAKVGPVPIGSKGDAVTIGSPPRGVTGCKQSGLGMEGMWTRPECEIQREEDRVRRFARRIKETSHHSR